MPRPPRIEVEGGLYHLTSRGNGRQIIFHGDGDRLRFLDQLQDNLETFEVSLYAFALMSNHYHLLIRTRRANLARFVQRLNTSYALYHGYKHGQPGHVFQGRYHAKLVDGDEYLLRLTRYIHLNPIKTEAAHGLSVAERVRRLDGYRWSSYPGYTSEKRAVAWVDYAILRHYGRTLAEARRRYQAYVRAMAMENDEPLRDILRANPYAVGEKPFLDDVERQLKSRCPGDAKDRDVAWPADCVKLIEVDHAVAQEYGVDVAVLKLHGHVAGEAKVMAVELAARVSGLTQREIGQHYGGISSSAVAMIRRAVRSGSAEQQARITKLLGTLRPTASA